MNSQPLSISVLYGTGIPNPEYRELLSRIDDLKPVREASDPAAFFNQHAASPPDLVLVDLDGSASVPPWLSLVTTLLPQTEVMVCSHSRDPDFLIEIMKLRAGGFMPLPLNREDLLGVLARVKAEKKTRQASLNNQILAVTGSKGGVGTTTVATNLAVAMAEMVPEGVILVDLARPFPQVGQFLDLKCHHSMKDLVDSADTLDPIFLKKIVQRHKSGLGVLLNYPDYHRRSNLVPNIEAMRKIFAMLRASYHWVVVDLGIWLDSFYSQILAVADQILLVTELTLPNLQNLRILKSLFHDWDLSDREIKIVVNRYLKNYALGLKDLENLTHRLAVRTLPDEHHTLLEAVNQGEALNELAPRSRMWRQLRSMAAELIDQQKNLESDNDVVVKQPGFLKRLMKRGDDHVVVTAG
ncbi:MAG: AAA family ATPase [Deltaproteobacteria bacterium]|nr:AAA family ATPase [Deltaproteobacteria bacterium]